jgi:hypothetical protein
MVVDRDIEVVKLSKYNDTTLVRRFYGKLSRKGSPAKRVDHHWKPLIGYSLVFHVLIRGWICFMFNLGSDCEMILEKNWN